MKGTGRDPHGGVGPIDAMTLHRWIRNGYLDLPLCGTGRRRAYPPPEMRAIHALDSCRRLGGTKPSAESHTPATRGFLAAVSAAARTHAPGEVDDLPSPVPWIRLVLVVPNPADDSRPSPTETA